MNNFLDDLNLRGERQKKTALEEVNLLEAAKEALLEEALKMKEAKEKPKAREFILIRPAPPVVPPVEVKESTPEVEKPKGPIQFSIIQPAPQKPVGRRRECFPSRRC